MNLPTLPVGVLMTLFVFALVAWFLARARPQ
jgi:hypothetical protein